MRTSTSRAVLRIEDRLDVVLNVVNCMRDSSREYSNHDSEGES
jgi:hypothetical protein